MDAASVVFGEAPNAEHARGPRTQVVGRAILRKDAGRERGSRNRAAAA